MALNRNYLLILTGFGISNLGNWIYLIALNLSVWHLTHSPAAVSGLFIVGPVARIFCNFFAGTFIDRHNKRRIIIWRYCARHHCLSNAFCTIRLVDLSVHWDC